MGEREKMTAENSGRSVRRFYRRPELKQVKLIAEEAVLQSCKATQGFLWNWGNDNCYWWGRCQTIGS